MKIDVAGEQGAQQQEGSLEGSPKVPGVQGS